MVLISDEAQRCFDLEGRHRRYRGFDLERGRQRRRQLEVGFESFRLFARGLCLEVMKAADVGGKCATAVTLLLEQRAQFVERCRPRARVDRAFVGETLKKRCGFVEAIGFEREPVEIVDNEAVCRQFARGLQAFEERTFIVVQDDFVKSCKRASQTTLELVIAAGIFRGLLEQDLGWLGATRQLDCGVQTFVVFGRQSQCGHEQACGALTVVEHIALNDCGTAGGVGANLQLGIAVRHRFERDDELVLPAGHERVARRARSQHRDHQLNRLHLHHRRRRERSDRVVDGGIVSRSDRGPHVVNGHRGREPTRFIGSSGGRHHGWRWRRRPDLGGRIEVAVGAVVSGRSQDGDAVSTAAARGDFEQLFERFQ